MGEPVEAADPFVEEDGWDTIRAPGARTGFLLAALLGASLTAVLLAAIILEGLVRPPSAATDDVPPVPWPALAAVFVAFVPLHELFHLIVHPGWGLTDRTTVVVWPARLQIGVHYEGVLTRARWIAMRLAPLALLTLVPAMILLASPALSPASEPSLALLAVLNALGSGGDLLAVLLVMRQVPPSGRLRFRQGRVRASHG